jgi:hypothetical protein
LRRTEAATIDNPVPQLCVGLLQIVVHHNLVMGTGLLGELQLVNCLVQTLAQTVCISEDPKLAQDHDITYNLN